MRCAVVVGSALALLRPNLPDFNLVCIPKTRIDCGESIIDEKC